MSDIELRVTTNFEQVEAFEQRIVGNIPKEEHEFFALRNMQWYHDNLRQGDHVIGAYDGDKMVGKGILTCLAQDEYDTTSLCDFAGAAYPDKIGGDLCGTFVDPAYSGPSLQSQIIEKREGVAQSQGVDYMIAVTLTQNFKSIASLLRKNYVIQGVGLSEAPGQPWLYFCCKDFNAPSLKQNSGKEHLTLPAKDEKTVIDKIQDGWIGVSITRSNEKSAPYLSLVR
jgi:GNAT superfamily N-acetyltransferase